MKYILPRVIGANRGDLASRWSLLRGLNSLGLENDVGVFCHSPEDVPPATRTQFGYGPFHNLVPRGKGYRALRSAITVLWAVGLDFQDDSSLIKLLYLWFAFRRLRSLGLEVMCVFQGAGPIETEFGKRLAARVLDMVSTFVARDPGTHQLIKELSPDTRCILAHDAIFLPGLEMDLPAVSKARLHHHQMNGDRIPLVGFNMRQWFHFASSLIPYRLQQKAYQRRSEAKMAAILEAATSLIKSLRDRERAKIFLISAYQPGPESWEDDLFWLRRLKSRLLEDEGVVLVESPMTMPEYFGFISNLDLLVGMRLHSTLTALRFGIPSFNISYTLKGKDILSHLDLEDQVIELADFIADPEHLYERAAAVLNEPEPIRIKIRESVENAVVDNFEVLRRLLEL